jgi:hypothetical protein
LAIFEVTEITAATLTWAQKPEFKPNLAFGGKTPDLSARQRQN